MVTFTVFKFLLVSALMRIAPPFGAMLSSNAMFAIKTASEPLMIIMLVDSLTSPSTNPAPFPFTTWLFPLMITVPLPVMEIGLAGLIKMPFSL